MEGFLEEEITALHHSLGWQLEESFGSGQGLAEEDCGCISELSVSCLFWLSSLPVSDKKFITGKKGQPYTLD